jgi:hypothetical protein
LEVKYVKEGLTLTGDFIKILGLFDIHIQVRKSGKIFSLTISFVDI